MPIDLSNHLHLWAVLFITFVVLKPDRRNADAVSGEIFPYLTSLFLLSSLLTPGTLLLFSFHHNLRHVFKAGNSVLVMANIELMVVSGLTSGA